MGHLIELDTVRAHPIGAYLAPAAGTPKGGVVVVQEIFGVNAHMRAVTDRLAEHGYTAIAPAFFDHVERDVQLDYGEDGYKRGRELIGQIGLDLAIDDVAVAAKAIAEAGRIGCIGFCWGGTVALLSAIRLGLPAVSYYGARNRGYLDETPKAPLQFHFGERDTSIPPEAIEEHREKLPQAEVHTYPAGHAFNRDVDPHAYDEASARLAWQRTLAFFDRHLAGA